MRRYFSSSILHQDFAKSAKKSLGQNFLIHLPTLETIASAVEVHGRDIVEVGPGYGALTEHLVAAEPRSLHLVELDRALAAHLRERMEREWHGANMALSEMDVLDFEPPYERYSVIANIPYYITSPILFRFLYELPNPPEAMVILMQREVGDRILESDGKSSLLSLALSARCRRIERVMQVPAERFRPAPKVDSSVLLFEVDAGAPADHRFVDFLKRWFSQPRKKLSGNLAGDRSKSEIESVLSSLGLRPDARPESLGLDEWRRLHAALGR